MREITIASIWPLKVGILRPLFTPQNEFWIDGVDADASPSEIRDRLTHPKTVAITSQEQRYRAPVTHFETTQTITAEELAADFIQATTTNAPGMGPECHPGIWICEGGSPTDAEIRAANRVQAPFLQYQFSEGNRLATDVDTAKIITRLMRISAMALGREPEWLNPPSDLDVMACPYCMKSINKAAVTCSECHQVVNFEKFAELEARKKAAIKNYVAA